ncbi:23S rRNA (pseudouridine(1915)-N(3))-methyltransferase RlmH [bacterium]|nr:23S rRNA (pseudouridine(1915)-N(3))-methyltransferase RlmH [bacterium]
MNISLISVGKLKQSGGFSDMAIFYQKRIAKYAKLHQIELKERPSAAEETQLIQKAIPNSSFVIALREEGKSFDTAAFADLFRKIQQSGKAPVFVVGGAYGYGDVGEDLALSIAPWTLPHQLARIILLEQMYRSLSLISGSKYHHG